MTTSPNPAALPPMRFIAAGVSRASLPKLDGSLWVAGSNGSGQAGLDARQDTPIFESLNLTSPQAA